METRAFIHEVLLGVGLFLAAIAVNSIEKISNQTEEIRIHLATIAEKVMQHEARISRLEK